MPKMLMQSIPWDPLLLVRLTPASHTNNWQSEQTQSLPFSHTALSQSSACLWVSADASGGGRPPCCSKLWRNSVCVFSYVWSPFLSSLLPIPLLPASMARGKQVSGGILPLIQIPQASAVIQRCCVDLWKTPPSVPQVFPQHLAQSFSWRSMR